MDTWAHERIGFDKVGPLVEWERKWVNSGWATEEGKSTLPNSILLIPGTRTLHLITPIAKKIPLGLWLAYMTRPRFWPAATVRAVSLQGGTAFISHPSTRGLVTTTKEVEHPPTPTSYMIVRS